MTNPWLIVLFWVLIELLLVLIFRIVSKWLNSREGNKSLKNNLTSWLKGFLERMFLVFLFLAGFQSGALILFGAIKLGTRLDQDKVQKISNDYFLIGNFVSIAASVGIYLLLRNIVVF